MGTPLGERGLGDRRCAVLTLTPTAADAVRQLMASARASAEPHAGVRLSSGVPGPAGTPLEVALADEPEAADQTIEEGGATVFVEASAAEFLDEPVLTCRAVGTTVVPAAHQRLQH